MTITNATTAAPSRDPLDRPNRYTHRSDTSVDTAVASMQAYGYAVIEDVLSAGEVDLVRTRLEAAAAEADARGTRIRFPGMAQISRRIYYLPYYDDVFVDLARHPFATACVQGVLPGEFIIGNFGANMLSHGSGPQDLHRD